MQQVKRNYTPTPTIRALYYYIPTHESAVYCHDITAIFMYLPLLYLLQLYHGSVLHPYSRPAVYCHNITAININMAVILWQILHPYPQSCSDIMLRLYVGMLRE